MGGHGPGSVYIDGRGGLRAALFLGVQGIVEFRYLADASGFDPVGIGDLARDNPPTIRAPRTMAFDERPVEPGERARAALAVDLLLRMLLLTRQCFPDDDLETVVIYLTVASASVGLVIRDMAFLRSLGAEPLAEGMQRPLSARAVAASADFREKRFAGSSRTWSLKGVSAKTNTGSGS
jgi:hypothetical protein